MQVEVESLKAEIFALMKDTTPTQEMAEETWKAGELVTGALGETGIAVTKAELYVEEVHKDMKISGARMVRCRVERSALREHT